MTSYPNSRRGTLDGTPPEPGLAEWTSKIKAMQRQVDADEEAEQKRLEDEITASRLARLRRSHGLGSGSRVLNDLKVEAELAPSTGEDRDVLHPTGHINRQFPSRAPLGILQEGVPSTAPPRVTLNSPSRSSPSVASSRAEPTSLAAFIGGRATGPRLNRHAPQQDALDPTQFEQRTTITAPHPVFGRGGIAMPGMASRQHRSTVTPSANENTERAAETLLEVTRAWTRSRTLSSPSAQKPAAFSPSANLSGSNSDSRGDTPRERKTSTSTGTNPSDRRSNLAPNSVFSSNQFARSTPSFASIGSSSRPAESDFPKSHSSPLDSPEAPKDVASRPRSRGSNRLATSTPPHPREPIVIPSLARPIYPESRTSPQSHIPSQAPSPAFLRPPPKKDTTPSLSRLQGRGFVQNMVKVSSQLEQSPPTTSAERNRTPSGRKSSVLDRWQPTASSPSPPPLSPTFTPMRRSQTTGPTTPVLAETPPTETAPVVKPLKASVSFSQLRPAEIRVNSSEERPKVAAKTSNPILQPTHIPVDRQEKGAGSSSRQSLGSATTLVMFRPPKITPQPPAVDEHGVKHDTPLRLGRESSTQMEIPIKMPSRPLNHPTKERARKPRKAKDDTRAPLQHEQRDFVPTGTPTDIALSGQSGHETASAGHAADGTQHQGNAPSVLAHKPKKLSPQTGQVANSSTTSILPTSLDTPKIDDVPPPPPSPIRHSRIPSTGNRARVMEVAQALSEQQAVDGRDQVRSRLFDGVATQSKSEETTPTQHELRPKPPVTQAEKRKSSYEKYSSIILPPLREETTPVSSPAGTLNRSGVVPVPQPAIRSPANGEGKSASELVKFGFEDSILPSVNIQALVASHDVTANDPGILGISTDVMVISGSTATSLSHNANVFYDAEVLAVIQRSKNKSTGLVSTRLWGWKGSQSTFGEREEAKLNELAKRYSTTLALVGQSTEPSQLVRDLGGKLIIRQGTRAHWTAENTAMHIIRSANNVIHIDEVTLSVTNLCSAFSYCMTVLETLYVWHGCGSIALERRAAVEYANQLVPNGNINELYEGRNDDDDMFWMILGDDTYAKADYWKWRSNEPHLDPTIWRISAEGGKDLATRIFAISVDDHFHQSVYVVDCIWELFVVVGKNARHQRADIRLALSTATGLSDAVALKRPFSPPVHVLVLPSQLPLDLRHHFRDFDEVHLNGDEVPDHMNIFPSSEAFDQLSRRSWDRSQLRDHTMLPLGISPVDLSGF